MAETQTTKPAATVEKAAETKAPKTKSYPVLGRLRHDGVAYEPGDDVEMTPKQAGPLITAGVLGDVK